MACVRRKKKKLPCTINGCVAYRIARGLCDKHYQRLRRNGDPLIEDHPRFNEDWDGRCIACKKKDGPFPVGRRSGHGEYKSRRCMPCYAKVSLKWRNNNLEKAREIARRSANKRNRELRQLILEAYGRKCACCGEAEEIFLALDHKNNDGSKHRRLLGSSGVNRGVGNKVYVWVVKNKFPSTFQLLCHNCNWAKSRGGCPHKKKR